jgi:ribonuclease HI
MFRLLLLFAAILIHPKKTLSISGYIPAPTTNNRAEWAAVIEAVDKDLVLRFREIATPHKVSAVFVRGHVGHRHNEACDAAAAAAMKDKRDSYPMYCMKVSEPEAGE